MKETNIPPNDESDGKALLVLESKHGSRVIYDRNSISVTEKMYSWTLNVGNIKIGNCYGIICGVVVASTEPEAAKMVADKLMEMDPDKYEFLYNIHEYNRKQHQKELESKDEIDGSVPIYVPKYMSIDPDIIQISELTIANKFAIVADRFE